MELERLMSEFGDNRHELIKDLINRRHDGTIKLYVLWRILQHRRAHPRLYASGHYIPLTATGACSDNVCAFARSDAGHSVIVIVPRFLSQMNTLAGDIPASLDWNSTAVLLPESISGKTITNLLTGDQWPLEEHRSRLRLDHVLQSLPLALLEIAEPGATT